MAEEEGKSLELPPFVSKMVLRDTPNYRVVMDWKPGMERQKGGERFFIEPLTDEGLNMLEMAAVAHGLDPEYHFSKRWVHIPGEPRTVGGPCLRADFIVDNLPVLLHGEVQIPEEGEDTIPSLDRMEECLRLHPDKYTFSDET